MIEKPVKFRALTDQERDAAEAAAWREKNAVKKLPPMSAIGSTDIIIGQRHAASLASLFGPRLGSRNT